jgi:penicillin-binding protein 1A
MARTQAEPPERRSRIGRWLAGAAALITVLVVAVSAWVWFAPCWLGGCAPLDDLAEYQAEGSQLLDVHGEPFAILATVNRRIVPLDSLPPHLPQAYVAVEDQRFYSHSGVDVLRVGGAFLSNLRRRGVAEGGSTITMQLARNLFPDYLPYRERTVRRKVMETRIARQLERSFPKDKILELYLNHIYLGSGAYGVDAAARTYFGKSAVEVTLTEAALLAGLAAAPSGLDPTRNQEGARERRNLVLRRMAEAGYITQSEADEAREEPVRLARGSSEENGPDGSYFVERVRRELSERVGQRFYTAGLRIHTTFDPRIQEAAEQELARQLTAIESGQYGAYGHETYAATRGLSEETGDTPYLQGAVVIMEAHTGEVRALVGGRDWNDSKFDRATQALRQPGSAFKPFVYLAALERYRTPVDQLDDSPLRVELSGGRVWQPRNFGDRYDGMVTVREALTRSKNTATVRLAQDVGIGSAIRYARDLGVSSELPEFPATALGAAEVRPVELVASYAALSNGGQRVSPYVVSRVEDRYGRVLWDTYRESSRAISPGAAFVLTSILRDAVDRGTGTAVRAAGFRGPAAGKTGTTNENTDVWFIGYTPDLVGGVWIGFDRPKRIVSGASGGALAAPVWGRIMNRVYQQRPMPDPWARPAGVVAEEVEQGSGAIVTADCPARGPTYTEYFVSSPPRGLCPRDSYYAADGTWVWGDEEWDAGIDTLEDRGILWPELEELRRQRSGDTVFMEPAIPDTVEPVEPATPAIDTIIPTIREEDLPGIPVIPDADEPAADAGQTNGDGAEDGDDAEDEGSDPIDDEPPGGEPSLESEPSAPAPPR